VFLMARINPILGEAPEAAMVVAVVGAVTALFAATIACAQDDIKRVLAYSTISQLGYMFLAVGSGAFVAAIFHMVTHAFFKALLFLGAGSVIHGLGDEQDMKRMGGLRRFLPITTITFLVGWLAIAGVPPFSGFWSKDEILISAWDKHPALWVAGAVTALLSAYYMSRQVFLVFFGPDRWKHAAEERTEEEAAAEPEHEPAAAGGHGEPHESPPVMWVPLVALAGLAAVGGLLNLPFKGLDFLGDWLHPVVGEHELHVSNGLKWGLPFVVAGLAVAGILAARQIWLRGAVRPEAVEPEVLRQAWGVEPAYAAFKGGPGRVASNWLAYVMDAKVVDGAVNGVGALVRMGGAQLRRAQTGYVRNYAIGVAAGAVLLLGFVISRAGT
jgi:NADH-quinone oxidoreductase subunit L